MKIETVKLAQSNYAATAVGLFPGRVDEEPLRVVGQGDQQLQLATGYTGFVSRAALPLAHQTAASVT